MVVYNVGVKYRNNVLVIKVIVFEVFVFWGFEFIGVGGLFFVFFDVELVCCDIFMLI